MNLPLFIAKRYLFSKRNANIINIISGISIVGVSVGTMALVVVLSVMNGFDGLIKSLFSSFDSDLRITIVEGKSFSSDNELFNSIRNMPEVAYFSEIVEENALLRYDERQTTGVIKGVDDEYSKITGIDSMLVNGEFILKNDNLNFAVMGLELANELAVGLRFITPLHVYVPRKGKKLRMSLESNFNHNHLFPSGIFSIQQELDSKYVIVPIEFARDLFELEDKVTAIEIELAENSSADNVQDKIKQILGDGYYVKNRYQQHDYLYKIIKSEKWTTYLILIFILLIASFNIIGSLTMLILDKREDITTLRNLGANRSLIKKIFLLEGWSISVIGAVAGTILGVLLCIAQHSFGLLKLQGGDSFIVASYPVEVVPLDIATILGSVLLIGFFAAWLPVRHISGKYIEEDLH
jgi:lipoprotein-releasing system permease protein